MNSYHITLLCFLILTVSSCTNQTDSRTGSTVYYGEENTNAEILEKDFLTWWTYFNENIILSDDFVALDAALHKISKDSFLQELTSGRYIPIRMISKDSNTYLKLHALSENSDQDITNTIVNKSNAVYQQYKMEGSKFPDFDFSSIGGQRFNNENMLGKYLVLKCWFIACKACVEEFPELNDLVNEHKNRNDMEFVSLAYDAPESLRKFLTKREFTYSVVPVDRHFMESQLQVYNYPTHFIVDKSGIIKKVVNNVAELKLALAKEL